VAEIANSDLRLSDIPSPDVDWDDIQLFALTYNGYVHDDCAEIANARRHESLDDLRTCLFFEQRRWRHFGDTPEGDDFDYIRDVVAQIRAYVKGD